MRDLTRSELSFADFWRQRNGSETMFLNCYFTNTLSVFFAYAFGRLGVSANAVTIIGSLVMALVFPVALLLPTSDETLGVLIIYLLSQLAYVLDAADGQLARATRTSGPFGKFLDHVLDMLTGMLAFSGFFAFLYRCRFAEGDVEAAHLVLGLAFFFVASRAARHAAWMAYDAVPAPPASQGLEARDGLLVRLLKDGMDHQASLFLILLYLVAPIVALVAMFLQGLLLLAVYFRYFVRARRVL